MEEQQSIGNQYLGDVAIKLRDLEEKQKMLKERLLLIGQNLVELREKNREDMLEVKKNIEMLKRNTERLIGFLEAASGEFSKFARKEDLEILQKQARMFQPLEFARKKHLKK